MVSRPSLRTKYSPTNSDIPKHRHLRKVFVIFGGDSSERQVSLMSGTNVWLNLQASDDVSICQAIFSGGEFLKVHNPLRLNFICSATHATNYLMQHLSFTSL